MRVTYEITRWFGGRYRAQLYVDRHPVEKAFFANESDALSWCLDKQLEYAQEVR